MNKREKVIKGLECCKEENCNGIDCPYSMNYMCFPQIAEDALALIRELEDAVKEHPKVILCRSADIPASRFRRTRNSEDGA
jgi:hypothetical protein